MACRNERYITNGMRVLFGTSLILSAIALAFALVYLLRAYEQAFFLAIALVAVLFGYYIFEYVRWRKQG